MGSLTTPVMVSNLPVTSSQQNNDPDVDVINLIREWELEEKTNGGICNNRDEEKSPIISSLATTISSNNVSPPLSIVNNSISTVSISATNPPTQNGHPLNPLIDAELSTLSNLLSDVYNYERKQQDLVLQLIDALSLVKHSLEEELMNGNNLSITLHGVHELISTARRAKGDDVGRVLTELQLKRKIIEGALIKNLVNPLSSLSRLPSDALRLIHTFTSSKLGSHINNKPMQFQNNQQQQQQQRLPRFYFDMEINGLMLGRVVIETRPDVAPRMCENFKQLVTGERGFGFLGCSVFQCWRGESVITGDFEHNNGRGGHSIFETGLFMPEDTRLPSTRGSIGMRRTQKRHDSKGLVGSQFRIILQDMPGFTGIFGRVVEGIDLVDKISECGDPSGNPMKRIIIRRCGPAVNSSA